MSSSGLELSTIATMPTAVGSLVRLRRRQSLDSYFTERRSASVQSTNEAPGPLANLNPKADQPEPSTNVSAPTDSPINSRAPSDLEKNDGQGGECYVVFVLFILSAGVGVTVYDRFMHFGAPTTFPSGDIRKGFSDPPNTRGTFNIITACFATILTCVYRSLHLDVPYSKEEEEGEGEFVKVEKRYQSGKERNSRQQDVESGEGTAHGREPRWRGWANKVVGWANKDAKEVASWPKRGAEVVASWRIKLWMQMKSMKQRAVWVIFNILAPELVAYVAAVEFLCAKNYTKDLVELFREEHGIDLSNKWTIAHQHMANMGGFKVPVEGGGYLILRSSRDFGEWARINPEAFMSIKFKQVGIDIKAYSTAKALLVAALGQAGWLVFQTLERVCKGLPVTELDVTTCAYVACAIFTYLCWWSKPYGVQNHILLHVTRTPRPNWRQDTNPTPINRAFRFRWNSDDPGNLELPAIVLSGIIGAVVGAIHCTLWNAQFANTNGQLLWRVCCITQIVAPILMSVLLAMPSLRVRGVDHGDKNWEEKWDKWALLSALIPCFFQFCARIVIFILIGYSFWSQPADVYRVADWSWSWFPHIS